jgi:hypothetical protein
MTKSEIFAKMNALANELVAKDGKMSRAEAIVKVTEQHPELYRQYRDAADSLAPAQAEHTTVRKIAQQAIQKEIERLMKARGLDCGAAAIVVAREHPDLITLTKDSSSSRLVDTETIQKSVAWLQEKLDMTPGKALVRAIEYDALPPPAPTVPVPRAPAVQKKDSTDEQIKKAIGICEDMLDYLGKEYGVAPRRPVRKFGRAMTFNEIRALDRATAA